MQRSISIIISALNEEHALPSTLDMIINGAARKFGDYELLIFNDGSQDKTGEIADAYAAENNRIRVIHTPQNRGIGYSFRTGVEMASKKYIGFLPGDTSQSTIQEDIDTLFDAIIEADQTGADFVLEYIISDARSFFRKFISQGYAHLMNVLFLMNLKYFNGANFYRYDCIKPLKIASDGYGVLSEILIRAIKSGHTYVEVGVLNRDTTANSKAVKASNFTRVIKSVSKLFWEIQIVSRFQKSEALTKPQFEVLSPPAQHTIISQKPVVSQKQPTTIA